MKYRFQSGCPVNRDEWVFKLTRYHEDGKQEVLTEDGWAEFQDFDAMPTLPGIPGYAMTDMMQVDRAIWEMEERIKQAIQQREEEDAIGETIEQQAERVNDAIQKISGVHPSQRGQVTDPESSSPPV